MQFETILALINTLGLLYLGFLKYGNEKRQASSQEEVGEADAAEKITNSATSLVQQMQTELALLRPMPGRVTNLEMENSNLRKSNERLIQWAERLVLQIESAGLDPVPFRMEPESDRMKTLPTEKKK